MKHNKILAVAWVCAIMAFMAGCQKEKEDAIPEDALFLNAENLGNNAKMYTSGTRVTWANNDNVWLNGTEYTVTVTGEKAYVDGSGLIETNPLYGYASPTVATGTGAENQQTTNPTVYIPKGYTGSFNGEAFKITPPMAAYRTSTGNTVEFKHITAALRIGVKNTTGTAVTLDSVVVTSSSYQLCGLKTLDLTADDFGLAPATTDYANQRRIRIKFSSAVSMDNNATKYVQVPILPIPSTEPITVEVFTSKTMSGGLAKARNDYNYSRTVTSHLDLGRNEMASMNVSIATSGTYMTVVERGLFTINGSGKKVRFAQGNLQWTGSTKKYSYATNQYDYLQDLAGLGKGNLNSSNRTGQSVPIDLFGWGTSGWNPTGDEYRALPHTSISSVLKDGGGRMFGPYNVRQSLTGDSARYDWGVYASNGGDGTKYMFVSGITGSWRVLTSTEFSYIGNTPERGTYRYTVATVNSITGILLFPDGFDSLPTITGVTWNTSNINKTSGVGATATTTTAWETMEALGCVFLPVTGYRSGTKLYNKDQAYYWTASHSSGNAAQAYCAAYEGGTKTVQWSLSKTRGYGYSVRLVQPVN